jgi:hypothetical protein
VFVWPTYFHWAVLVLQAMWLLFLALAAFMHDLGAAVRQDIAFVAGGPCCSERELSSLVVVAQCIALFGGSVR